MSFRPMEATPHRISTESRVMLGLEARLPAVPGWDFRLGCSQAVELLVMPSHWDDSWGKPVSSIPAQWVQPLPPLVAMGWPGAAHCPSGARNWNMARVQGQVEWRMGVSWRRLAPLWALVLTLACARGTGRAQDSSVEHGKSQVLLPGPQVPGGHSLHFLPPLRMAPVVRALNPAHNGRVCSTWGNFHYKTFDGDIFHFPGLCNYVLSAHCGAAYEDFNIQLRRGLESNATTVIRVTMKLDGMVIQLTKNAILANGQLIQLPFSQSGVLIEHSSNSLKVVARLGLVFMWSQDDSLLLELDAKYANQTCGLCGDFNSEPVFNEFLSHGVKLTPIQFGNLQKMDGPTEQCQDPIPVPMMDCLPGSSICEEILSSRLFSGCSTLVDASSYVQACRHDLCACEHANPSSCICHTLAEYSRQCAHAGGLPLDWRGPDLCPQTCPLNLQYRECGSPCADTCSNPEHSQLCEDHCMAGCFCPEGMVLDDIGQTGCIPASQCACVYNGATYAPGAVYSTDCTNCTCLRGQWSCQEVPCPGTCSVLGGAHFSTFDERRYTVHGDCSYVLVKPCNSSTFTVLAELRKCGLTDTETCLRSLTLSLGGGHTVITVKASGEVFVNQIYTQMPISAGNVTLFRPSTFFIIAQTNLGLQLDIQLVPIMQVFVRLGPELRGLTCGLCGNFNQNQADDFRALSGVVEGTAAAFANTWKTQAACPNVKNSFEDPCSLSVENEKYAQHWCSRLTDPHGPFAQCHTAVNPGTYYSNCMFDTCNCEKSEDCLCAALSSYVHACAANGVLLSGWRDGVCTKPMATCPKSLTYQYHIDTCQPTCRSRSHEDITCGINFVPVDGCTCPTGTFMDDTGKCVPPTSCPCYHGGSMVPNGESLHERGAICTCTQGMLTCIGGQVPTPVCTPPMVYLDCRNATPGATGAGCQKSCFTLDMDCYSSQCEPGCVCPDGLVSDGKGGCVAVTDCPCVHNEASYLPGQTIWVGCNTCTCKSRMWKCTDEPCLATCAVYGDGHYLTFDGRRYSFSGDCAYTLVQDHCGGNSTANATFRVVTENVPCGTTGVTCSKAIKLFLGSYELRLSGGSVEVIEKGAGQAAPYSIRQMGIYLVVDTEVGLVLLWDRKTSIFLKLSPEFKGRVCGLCGNFDDNAVNDFTTRSQSVVGSTLEFGNSWKFSPSCPDAPAPRDPCTANPYRKSWSQKQCSIINSATFAACHAHVEPAKYYEACVGDACACDSGGDCECFCTAVAAYAQACHDVGVCVSWRTPDICPLFCDYYNPEGQCEWHYQPCGAPCMRTCRNPSGRCLHDLHGLEGCYPKCPPEAPIFDEDQMQCVATCPTPPPPLPCRVQGKSYWPGSAVPSEENCQSCVCTESGVQCVYDAEACVCTYDGSHFHLGDVIYHTTDGTGGCISARCSVNGTIERKVYTCSSTTPAPPTTFSFSTPSLGLSAQVETVTQIDLVKSAKQLVDKGTGMTGTPRDLALPPSLLSSGPHMTCGEECLWSPWLDVSHPGRGIDSGDFDTLENLRAHGYHVCSVPKEVECQAEGAPEVPLQVLGQHVECSPTVGLVCYNRNQTSGLCYNYQIRILCCFPGTCSTSSTPPPPPASTPTPSRITETQNTCSRYHYTYSRYHYPCPEYSYTPAGYLYDYPKYFYPCPEYSFICPSDHCDHPRYSYTCPRYHHHHNKYSYTYPKSSTTPAPCLQNLCSWTHWFDGSYPEPGINGGDFDTFPNLRATGYKFCEKPSNVECRAAFFPNIPLDELGQDVICDKSVGLMCLNKNQFPPICYNYEIRIQCSITINCQPQCRWTKWFDVDFPSPGPHGGDAETFCNIKKRGEKICRRPEYITQLECRAESHPEVSIDKLGQVVQCNLTKGLVCRNQDQKGNVGMCLNYEVRVLCCETSEGQPKKCVNNNLNLYANNRPNICARNQLNLRANNCPNLCANNELNFCASIQPNISARNQPNLWANNRPNNSSNNQFNYCANNWPNLCANNELNFCASIQPNICAKNQLNLWANNRPHNSSNNQFNYCANNWPNNSSNNQLNLCAKNQTDFCVNNQPNICARNQFNLCANYQPKLCANNEFNFCTYNQPILYANNEFNFCASPNNSYNKQLNLCANNRPNNSSNNQFNYCANNCPNLCANNELNFCASIQPNICARNQLNLWANNRPNNSSNNQFNYCANNWPNNSSNNQFNYCANNWPNNSSNNQLNLCAKNQTYFCVNNQPNICARNQLKLCANNNPNLCANNELNFCASIQPNICARNQLKLCANNRSNICARNEFNLWANYQANLCANNEFNFCTYNQPILCANNEFNFCASIQPNICARNQLNLWANNRPNNSYNKQLNLCANNRPNNSSNNQFNYCANNCPNLCANNELNFCASIQPNICARNQLNLWANNRPNNSSNNQFNYCANNWPNNSSNNQFNYCANNWPNNSSNNQLNLCAKNQTYFCVNNQPNICARNQLKLCANNNPNLCANNELNFCASIQPNICARNQLKLCANNRSNICARNEFNLWANYQANLCANNEFNFCTYNQPILCANNEFNFCASIQPNICARNQLNLWANNRPNNSYNNQLNLCANNSSNNQFNFCANNCPNLCANNELNFCASIQPNVCARNQLNLWANNRPNNSSNNELNFCANNWPNNSSNNQFNYCANDWSNNSSNNQLNLCANDWPNLCANNELNFCASIQPQVCARNQLNLWANNWPNNSSNNQFNYCANDWPNLCANNELNFCASIQPNICARNQLNLWANNRPNHSSNNQFNFCANNYSNNQLNFCANNWPNNSSDNQFNYCANDWPNLCANNELNFCASIQPHVCARKQLNLWANNWPNNSSNNQFNYCANNWPNLCANNELNFCASIQPNVCARNQLNLCVYHSPKICASNQLNPYVNNPQHHLCAKKQLNFCANNQPNHCANNQPKLNICASHQSNICTRNQLSLCANNQCDHCANNQPHISTSKQSNPQCTWTKWFDVDFPSPGPHGGDAETFCNIKKRGEKICRRPEYIAQLECRAESHPEVSIDKLGQVVQCNVTKGLVCRNRDQKGNVGMCLNYEVRVLCCETPEGQPKKCFNNNLNLYANNKPNLWARNHQNHCANNRPNICARNQLHPCANNRPNLCANNELNFCASIQPNICARNQLNLCANNWPKNSSNNQFNYCASIQPNICVRNQLNLCVNNQPNIWSRNQLNLWANNWPNLCANNELNFCAYIQPNICANNELNFCASIQPNICLNLCANDWPNLCANNELNFCASIQPQVCARNQLNLWANNWPKNSSNNQFNYCANDWPNLCDNNELNFCASIQPNICARNQLNLWANNRPNHSSNNQFNFCANNYSNNQLNFCANNWPNNSSDNQFNYCANDWPNLCANNELNFCASIQPHVCARKQLNLWANNWPNNSSNNQFNYCANNWPNLCANNELNFCASIQPNVCARNQLNLCVYHSPKICASNQLNPYVNNPQHHLCAKKQLNFCANNQPNHCANNQPKLNICASHQSNICTRNQLSLCANNQCDHCANNQPHISTSKQSNPQCTWTKWFDVDFPSPGPHGGDAETFCNIKKRGEKICRRPEYIAQLECRAESHPEVSIDKLGQVVQCNVTKGLVCRNRDQKGNVGMCLNYEVRVLCCETPEHCGHTSVTPHVTSSTNRSPPPESTSVVSTVSFPSSVAPSTTTCYCSVSGKLYPAGSIIYQQTDLAGHCYYAMCSLDCQVVRWSDQSCSSSKGETWPMPNCSQATCQGNGVITVHPRSCPQTQPPTCTNGFPPVKVTDHDDCCPNYQCQCVCSGWGDPHYITFDGTYYSFLDNCTYVLVQQIVPVYGHFRVLINNYFCGAEDGLSCPQSIIVEYQQARVVMTRKPILGVMTNEIIFNDQVVRPGFQKDGVSVSQIGIKMYVTIPKLGVQVMFSGLIFSVEVPFSKFANNTEGQCGTCSNDKRDECRLPGGVEVASCSAMSSHWRVTTPGQLYCYGPLPTPTTAWPTPSPSSCPPAPVCHLILSKVFGPCHAVIPPLAFYEGCVFDHCHKTDSNVMCSALELYASLCASRGVCIDWRSHTNHTCRREGEGEGSKPQGPVHSASGEKVGVPNVWGSGHAGVGPEGPASQLQSPSRCQAQGRPGRWLWAGALGLSCGFCPHTAFTCPADKVYQPCGPSKPSYCYGSDNTSLMALQDSGPITEGCFCPEGMKLFSGSSEVCVPIDCHKCLGPHGKPVEPGHSITVDCQWCTCENHTLTMSCQRQPCPLPPACPLPGFVPVPAAPQAGQCCPQYNCACDTSYCPKPVACPEGSRPILTYEEGACCPSQNCMPSWRLRRLGAAVAGVAGWAAGEGGSMRRRVSSPTGWSVCNVNGTLYQPGSVVSSSLCETCRCEAPDGPHSDTVIISCETQICNTHCPMGFEYQPQSGQCCGLCVQQACVVNSSNNSTHLFYVSSGGGAWLGGPRAVEGVLGSCREGGAQGQGPPLPGQSCWEVLGDSRAEECRASRGSWGPWGAVMARQAPGGGQEGSGSPQAGRHTQTHRCTRFDLCCPLTPLAGSSLQPGQSWPDPGNPCMTHECEKHQDGLVVVTTKKACPPLSCPEEQALPSKDGCCLSCPLHPPHSSSTCAVYHEQQVISQQGCSSPGPVHLAYCQGNCGDSSSRSNDALRWPVIGQSAPECSWWYSLETKAMKHTCQCCQELRVSLRNVTLHCADGSSWVFSYPQVEECGCVGQHCGSEESRPEQSGEEQSEEIERTGWQRRPRTTGSASRLTGTRPRGSRPPSSGIQG
ncbi:mucin-5AC [Lycaon pictus]